MISGVTSEQKKLIGRIMENKPLKGTINEIKTLNGKVSVSVRDVPYYETSNSSGGITVYIGREITNNGSK